MLFFILSELKAECFVDSKNPYVQLWCAVLWQAVKDALSKDEVTRQDALNWFFSPDTDIPSFDWLCGILHLNKYKILSALDLLITVVRQQKPKRRVEKCKETHAYLLKESFSD